MDRTSHFLDGEQAVQYAYGAELYERELLYDDMVNHGEADYAGEAWGGKRSPFTIPGGTVEIETEDLRGRFNVNSLVTGDRTAAGYFLALCAELGVNRDDANLLLVKLGRLNPPPKPDLPPVPPRWLADASELMDYGLAAADFHKLAPYLTALPDSSGQINVNAASDMLLSAYQLGDTQIAAIHDAIAANGYVSAQSAGTMGIPAGAMGVTSDAFRMRATVRLNGVATRLDSTLYRHIKDGPKRILVIARTWGAQLP